MTQTKTPRAHRELEEDTAGAEYWRQDGWWYVRHDGYVYFGLGYNWQKELKRGTKRVGMSGMRRLNAFISTQTAKGVPMRSPLR